MCLLPSLDNLNSLGDWINTLGDTSQECGACFTFRRSIFEGVVPIFRVTLPYRAASAANLVPLTQDCYAPIDVRLVLASHGEAAKNE